MRYEIWDKRYAIGDMRYEIGKIEVYDIFGRIQKVESRRSQIAPSQIEINISHLPSGIYFLRVENEVVKIVKQ
jgi:hypothetical protein